MAAKVSIIIPTYNRSKLLERAIKSVIKQTYRPIELIVLNNACTDNTDEVIANIRADLNSKIELQYIKQSKNDRNAARNLGIAKATGEFICFLDDDDEFMPDKISKQLEHFKKRPDIDVSFTNSFLDAEGETEIFIDFKREGLKKHDNEAIKARLCLGNFIPITNVMIRANIIKKYPFDPKLHTLEDFDLWLRLIKDHKFDWIDEPLSLVHSHEHEKRYDQIQVRMDQINVILRHVNDFPEHFFGMMDKLERLKGLVMNEYALRKDDTGATKFVSWLREQRLHALNYFETHRPKPNYPLLRFAIMFNVWNLKRKLHK